MTKHQQYEVDAPNNDSRILPRGLKVVLIELVGFVDLIAMPHRPKERAIRQDLNLVRICPGQFLRA